MASLVQLTSMTSMPPINSPRQSVNSVGALYNMPGLNLHGFNGVHSQQHGTALLGNSPLQTLLNASHAAANAPNTQVQERESYRPCCHSLGHTCCCFHPASCGILARVCVRVCAFVCMFRVCVCVCVCVFCVCVSVCLLLPVPACPPE